MSQPIDELKNRLRTALDVRGMKQVELAEKTGLSRAAINQYLSGYTMPKSDRIYKLATALNVSESWLMGFDVEMEKRITEYRVEDVYTKDLAETVNLLKRDESAQRVLDYYFALSDEQKTTVQTIVESLAKNNQ